MKTSDQEKKHYARQECRAFSSWDQLLPVGQLSVVFHAIHGLESAWGKTGDLAEQNNYNLFRALNPHISPALVNPIISGSFKPRNFIHRFEQHYSTPGYLDIQVLPHFFKTVDELAHSFVDKKEKDEAEEFLAFVYMYFLICHPFVDGNGRVARSLLDYYNHKLDFMIHDVWNNSDPKFANEAFHKEAFNMFYCSQAHLISYDYATVVSLPIHVKQELTKLADHLIGWADNVRNSKALSSYRSVSVMANGIRMLHSKKGV